MTVTLESLGLGPIDSGIIRTAATTIDAFRALGREISVPAWGTVVSSLSGMSAQGVGEGGKKTASGSISAIPVGSNKIQSTVVLTEEAWRNLTSVEEAIFESFPNVIAKQTTAYTGGFDALPAGWANYGVFSGAGFATQTIGTDEAASIDFDDALANIMGTPSIAISTSMLAYMKRQRNSISGARVFEIDGETIDGFAYKTFASATKKMIIGDFNDYVYASTPLPAANGDLFRFYDQGEITDSNGVKHNLTDENKYAARYEELTSSAILNKGSFVICTPDAS